MLVLHLSKSLAIPKDAKYNPNTNEKCYLGQWDYGCDKIYLYKQHRKISAVVKDVFENATELFSNQIIGGINGSITQDNLIKMIKYDHNRIEVILLRNINDRFKLWIIPKLEAACRICELLIKKAHENEAQARNHANLYKEYHDTNNFETSCNQYQQALKQYQRAYNVIKKNKRRYTGNGNCYLCN